MRKVDELHSRVSGAIWRAEQAEQLGDGSAAEAWAHVSFLEEDLASAFSVSAPEGRIARRGAVRAALKAGDCERGESLAQLYMAEDGAPLSLRKAIQEILNENARTATQRAASQRTRRW